MITAGVKSISCLCLIEISIFLFRFLSWRRTYLYRQRWILVILLLPTDKFLKRHKDMTDWVQWCWCIYLGYRIFPISVANDLCATWIGNHWCLIFADRFKKISGWFGMKIYRSDWLFPPSLYSFIYFCLIISNKPSQCIFSKTVSLMPSPIAIFRYRNFIHQIHFIRSNELIQLLQHPNKRTIIREGGLLGCTKKMSGLYCLKGMFFCNCDKFIYQFLLCDIALCFRVITVIFIDPHAPLISRVYGD